MAFRTACETPCSFNRISSSGLVSKELGLFISYNIAQVDPSVADEEMRFHGVAALDLSRVLAPKMVTMSTDSSPQVFLAP